MGKNFYRNQTVTSRQEARKLGAEYALNQMSLRKVSLATVDAMRPTLLKWTVSNARHANVPGRWQDVWARSALRACIRDARKHRECEGASTPPVKGRVCYDFLFEGKAPSCGVTL